MKIYLREDSAKHLIPSTVGLWPGVEPREGINVSKETLARWTQAIRDYGDAQREMREARKAKP